MAEPYLARIVMRDHVGAPQIRPGDDLPVSVTMEGVVWVIEERPDDVVVAAYRCSDGGWSEVWAAVRTAIEILDRVHVVSDGRADCRQDVRDGNRPD